MFEYEKTEMYKIFVFSRQSSWNMTFTPETLSKGSKLAHKTERFSDFQNLENLLTCFASFWALEKLFKKNGDDQNLWLVELIVVLYRICTQFPK